MPPPEGGGRPPEGEPSPDSREALPPFDIENPEAGTRDAVDRANTDSVQARTKQLTDAYSRFELGINRFKETSEKAIKAAQDGGNPEEAKKLREQMNKTIDEQVARANQLLLETLHRDRGYPLFRITKTPDGRISFTRVTGVAGPENIDKAISRLSPRYQNEIRNTRPPEFARLLAEMYAGLSERDLNELHPVMQDFITRMNAVPPGARSVAYMGILNPALVPNSPEAVVKQFRVSPEDAREALNFIQYVNKADPRMRAITQRAMSYIERYNSSGAGNSGEQARNIPSNGPVANADIQIRELPRGANPETIKANFRNALQIYIERTSGPNATEADKEMEIAKLQMMGADIAASQLDPAAGRLVLKTVPLHELQSAQLMGALSFVAGFLKKFSKDNPKLNADPNAKTNAERQKRLKAVNERITAIDKELGDINAELGRTPPPNENRRKELTERKTKLEEEKKKLTQERDRLQKEISEGQNPPNSPDVNKKRIEEINKRIESIDKEIKQNTDELNRTPAPTEGRRKELENRNKTLEEEKKKLTEEREKLQKQGNTPPGGPGEGPRLPHTVENREALQKASDEAQKALTNAEASGTNHDATVKCYEGAIQALENEIAHLQEYANPEAVAPGRLGAIVKRVAELRDQRTSVDGPIWKKNEQEIDRARALPETDNPAKLRRFDALAAALRTQIEFLQKHYTNHPRLLPLAAALSDTIQRRADIEPRMPHTPETRDKLTKETEAATKTLNNALASGTDKPGTLRAFDAAITANEAELLHLREYQSPDGPINARMAQLAKNINELRNQKGNEQARQLRAVSDEAEALPQTDNPAKLRRLDAMITAYRNEIVFLQDTYAPTYARTEALQKSIATARRQRAELTAT
jgi:chromosome segregation ATPase